MTHPPHSKVTTMEHMYAIRGNNRKVPVKLLLTSNVSETPTPSQEPQPHLIESDEEHVTNIPNTLNTHANIIQNEPPPTPVSPIALPPTGPQTPASVQQTTTTEVIH